MEIFPFQWYWFRPSSFYLSLPTGTLCSSQTWITYCIFTILHQVYRVNFYQVAQVIDELRHTIFSYTSLFKIFWQNNSYTANYTKLYQNYTKWGKINLLLLTPAEVKQDSTKKGRINESVSMKSQNKTWNMPTYLWRKNLYPNILCNIVINHSKTAISYYCTSNNLNNGKKK